MLCDTEGEGERELEGAHGSLRRVHSMQDSCSEMDKKEEIFTPPPIAKEEKKITAPTTALLHQSNWQKSMNSPRSASGFQGSSCSSTFLRSSISCWSLVSSRNDVSLPYALLSALFPLSSSLFSPSNFSGLLLRAWVFLLAAV